MVKKMEAYAINLEEIVKSRKAELVEEKKKSDRLLYKMLPSYVPNQMIRRMLLFNLCSIS